MEISWGKGVLRAKLLEEKYEAKLEFPWGWGVGGGLQNKNPSMGRIDTQSATKD